MLIIFLNIRRKSFATLLFRGSKKKPLVKLKNILFASSVRFSNYNSLNLLFLKIEFEYKCFRIIIVALFKHQKSDLKKINMCIKNILVPGIPGDLTTLLIKNLEWVIYYLLRK